MYPAPFKHIYLLLLVLLSGSAHAYLSTTTAEERAEEAKAMIKLEKQNPFAQLNGFITCDCLYWRAFQGGLDTTIPYTPSISTSSSFSSISSQHKDEERANVKRKDLDFHWDFGYRVGTGYRFEEKGWDVGVYITHFRTKAHRTLDTTHTIRWKLKYEVADLLLGYKYDAVACLNLRSIIGVRAAKIEQQIYSGLSHASLSGYSDYSSVVNSDYSFLNSLTLPQTHKRQQLKGWGPFVGIEGVWNFGSYLSLYAKGAAGTVYGRYKVKSNEVSILFSRADQTSTSGRLQACQYFIEAEIGLRLEQIFCGFECIFQLGLETHRYFDHNRIGSDGDLCLDGGHFSVGLVF